VVDQEEQVQASRGLRDKGLLKDGPEEQIPGRGRTLRVKGQANMG